MQSRSSLSETGRARLIEAVAASQDRHAFIALFEFYAPRIKSQAMRFSIDASVAEDIAQDAMLAVWRRAKQFDPGRGTASAWVFTIATNARIDRMRRDRHIANSVEIEGDEPLAAPETDDCGADAQRLKGIVSSLPQEQRQMVQLSFYREMPHAEIAAHLGVPLGTVKSRIRLAMAKLRQALRDKP
jgi:RNA polymerase sigma-70 factor (ECF subfamily)